MAPTVDLAALPTNPSIYTMDFQRTDIPVDIADDDGNSPTPALESKLNGSLPSFTLKPPSTRPLLAPSPLPPVLPDDFAHPLDDSALETAVHVLSTEADALSYLSSLYASHPVAQRGFSRAVAGMTKSLQANGKVVIVGVGKSGKIGKKIESTLNSLGLLAMFMNPVEALHGDLGILRPNDIIILITFSGNTPELLALLPHIPSDLPVIALTAHTSYATLKLAAVRPTLILLPAPIPEPESASFDLCAPTTSTTAALALGDALSLAVARAVHNKQGSLPKDVFARNHPGGAIGMAMRPRTTLLDLATPLSTMPIIDAPPGPPSAPFSPPLSISSASDADSEEEIDWSPVTSPGSPTAFRSVMECLRLAVRSKDGWLRTMHGGVVPPRRLQSVDAADAGRNVLEGELRLVSGAEEWIRLAGKTKVDEVRRILRAEGRTSGVLAATVDGVVVGVCEVEEILEETLQS